ncbi:sulfatase [Coraliomargarita sp. W4R72]
MAKSNPFGLSLASLELKRWITLFVGIVAVLCVCAAQKSQPNVVFIVVDDLGWRDLGCYGSTFYETPNVDAFAQTAMRFTDAYAANPTCSPTRSSILTGQYPVRTGFTAPSGHQPGLLRHATRSTQKPDVRAAGPTSLNFLAAEYYTLGEAMKDAGYATAFLGKWHLGYAPSIPENNGFDYVVGGREHPGPPGMDNTRKFFPPWDADTLPKDVAPDTHIDDYIAEQAVNYIASHREEPFFMCFWPYSVHSPFQSKPELIEQWQQRVDLNNPQHDATMAAMVEVMDTAVGRVMDALEANGIADNTIVIFTSDNGGNMYNNVDGTTATNNAPLRSGKGNNYEGGVRVPLMIRWPGVTEAGSTNRSVISSVDHYPAILEMLRMSARPQDHKDGVSYVPALQGQTFDRGPTICDWTHHIYQTNNLPNTSVRMGEWKLLRFWFDNADGSHRYELYDLSNDIGESQDLAAAYPERVDVMAQQLDAYYAKTGALQPNPNKLYNGHTLGVWVIDAEGGSAMVQAGNLILKSTTVGFGASTRVVPWAQEAASFEFEARALSGSCDLAVQWKSRAEDAYDASTRQEVVRVERDWQRYRVPLAYKSILNGLRMGLAQEDSEVEIREARVLTKTGTQMMGYTFH